MLLSSLGNSTKRYFQDALVKSIPIFTQTSSQFSLLQVYSPPKLTIPTYKFENSQNKCPFIPNSFKINQSSFFSTEQNEKKDENQGKDSKVEIDDDVQGEVNKSEDGEDGKKDIDEKKDVSESGDEVETEDSKVSTSSNEEAEEISREEMLEKEIEELKQKVQDVDSQRIRAFADAENARRIAKNDVLSAKSFAIKSFAKSLLEVNDNLDRAYESIKDQVEKSGGSGSDGGDDGDGDGDGDGGLIQNVLEGVSMTQTGLVKAFQSNGIQQVLNIH